MDKEDKRRMGQEKKEQKEKKKEQELRKKFKVSFLLCNVDKGIPGVLFSIVKLKIHFSSAHKTICYGR